MEEKMGKLKYIAFAGIDEKTSVMDLQKLYEDYQGKVVFGFLFSKSMLEKGDSKRYPNPVILKRYKNSGLNLSLHVCGRVARDIWKNNDWSVLEKEMGSYLPMFSSIQLNVGGLRTPSYIYTGFNEGKWALSPPPNNQEVIIQQTLNNPSVWDSYHISNVEDIENNMCFLLDNSGGRGIREPLETTLTGVSKLGYAGGITVNNCLEVKEESQLWSDIAVHDYYLDLESGCRDSRDWFSVGKCRQICEQCL